MSDRIEQMRKNIDALNDAGVRSTYFYPMVYESLQQTKGEPTQIRRAKAIAHLMDESPIEVLPYELLAGTMAAFCPVAKNVPPYEETRKEAVQIIEDYLRQKKQGTAQETVKTGEIKTFEADFTTKKSRWALMSRVHHDANIDYSDLQKLIAEMQEQFKDEDIEKYEIGRELERSFKIDYGKGVREEIDALPWFAANHLSLNYGRIVEQGLGATKKRIVEKLGEAKDEEKKEYYNAALITVESVIRYIMRYADELKKQSKNEMHSKERRQELAAMAEICAKVSTEKADTFYEGVQLVWLLHMVQSICWGSALSFGRFDQYLAGLYENDIKNGTITKDQAKEILCCMWLKVNEPRMRTVQSLTVGGITPDGKDAANSLTRLCLEVVREMKLPYPNVGARINKLNPEWLYDEIVDSIRAGGGQPMIMNDDVWIAALRRLGYEDKYANDYYNMGCVEIMIPGKQPNWGVTDPIAFPMLIEDIFTKYRQGSLKLDTFEDFYAAYVDELKAAVAADRKEAQGKIENMAGRCFDPFASLLIDGCIENGKDMFQGGSEIGTHWSVYAYGLGTAADAMAAVKKFVYDDKTVSIAQMSEALEHNFEGYEKLQAFLDTKTPSYGNDKDDVDLLAKDMLLNFTDIVFDQNEPGSRDKYVSTLFGYFFHIYHGEITGATPNGRRRGETFSDSMGPSQGKDVSGPTRMLNSVLKLNHDEVTGGYALNLKINPELVRDGVGINALKALVKSYIEGGGPQLQVNFVDVESLKKAKTEPEKYRNLIVRIGGYCEYFVNLDGSLQDEIITRTIHGL